MIAALIACLGTAFTPAGPSVDADQFAQLMMTVHAPLRDVSFVYEGDFRYVGPPSYIKGKKDVLDRTFQGFYAFRADGATLLDLYDRFPSRNDLMHETTAMLKWKVERIGQYADRKNAIGNQKLKYSGEPGTFFTDGTPARIFYAWYFQFWPRRWISEPDVTGYEFQGWEEVDGHRCLRVQRDALIHQSQGPVLRFWVDLDRGGHPLKVELWMGGKLNFRVDRIKLDRLPIGEKGELVWLPVSGMEEDFVWEAEHRSTPFFRSTYAIVYGSVKFNQGLTDDQFTLNSNLLGRTTELSKIRRTFDTTPPMRTDPEGVKLRLEASLVEADQQSKELKASEPAAEGQAVTTAWQLGSAGIALLLFGSAAVWKWRSQ